MVKMKSSLDDCRFYDYPLRTCLVYDHECNSPISNLGECSCGSCDYCQSVCSESCECCYCEEHEINGFSKEVLIWVSKQPEHVRKNYLVWQGSMYASTK